MLEVKRTCNNATEWYSLLKGLDTRTVLLRVNINVSSTPPPWTLLFPPPSLKSVNFNKRVGLWDTRGFCWAFKSNKGHYIDCSKIKALNVIKQH